MEPFLFLGGLVVVLLLLARSRLGGRALSPDEQSTMERGRPIGYGQAIHPPGSPNNVDAAYGGGKVAPTHHDQSS